MIAGIIVLILISVYTIWLLILAVAWMHHTRLGLKVNTQAPVSILIPCRNEASSIIECLNSIFSQKYPSQLIEVWVIDDHSDDATADLVIKDGRSKLIRLPEEYKGKKAALTYAMQYASNELIITRDADTTANESWLQTIVNEVELTNADMVIAPVTLTAKNNFLNLFDRFEYYAFTIITGGTAFIKEPVLCNGANLAFKKSVFQKVNGYKGNDFIASGDDVFLMNKISNVPGSIIKYVKDYKATVFTPTENSLSGFIQQRLRWAGKNARNTNLWSAFTAILVFSANISWLLLAVLSVFYAQSATYLLIITVIKCIIDFLLLFLGSTFHKQGKALFAFPLLVLLYPVYIALIAVLSIIVKPTWKGRKIN